MSPRSSPAQRSQWVSGGLSCGDGCLAHSGVGVFSLVAKAGISGDEGLFIKPQEARDGAHKATIENAAGQRAPLLGFKRFQKAVANARSGADFIE